MRVWIVEMWDLYMDRWTPTVGIGLDRATARREMKNWKGSNPDYPLPFGHINLLLKTKGRNHLIQIPAF